MATKKQKQELIDTLKFTPRRVRLMIQGYGGEAYAGTVDRKIYNYFAQQRIDLDEYASDWDGEFNNNVPAEFQPFMPGSAYECDNLWHASGAELSDLNSITVEEVDTNLCLWDYNLGHSNLEDAGVSVIEGGGTDLDDLDEGTVVMWGGQGEKGCFFDAEFTLTAPFDPKKLSITYENCDGWYIITSVEYNSEELEGTDGYSTTGKWAEHKWIIVGNEEVYDSVLVEDRENEGLSWGTVTLTPNQQIEFECVQCSWRGPVDDTHDNDGEMVCPECGEPVEAVESDPAAELEEIFEEHMFSEWFDSKIKPARPGEYECEFKVVTWPWPAVRRCTWTGRTWKDANGEKATGEFRWRGVKEEFRNAV